jgi:hypothetical protein
LSDGAFKTVPVRTRISVVSTALTGSTVGERVAKPISELELDTAELVERKCAGILVVSEELLRFGGAGSLNLLNNELRKSVAIASDVVFVDQMLNDTNISSFASSGMTASALVTDITSALDNLSYGSDGKLYLVASAETCKMIAMARASGAAPTFPDATLTGGSISGMQIVASDAVGDVMLILDASQVAANSGQVVLDASSEAAVELNNSPTSSPTAMTSLWQQGLRGLRAERTGFGVELLRPTAAVAITGATE